MLPKSEFAHAWTEGGESPLHRHARTKLKEPEPHPDYAIMQAAGRAAYAKRLEEAAHRNSPAYQVELEKARAELRASYPSLT